MNAYLQLPAAGSGWRRRWLCGPTYWGCQLAGWSSCVGLDLIVAWISGEANPVRRLFPWMVTCVVGLAVSHLLHAAILDLRGRLSGWRLVAAAAPCVLLAAALAAVIYRPLIPVAFMTAFPGEKLPKALTQAMAMNRFMFPLAGWMGFYFAITYYRSAIEGVKERLRLEALLKDAELRALRSQVNPHFLFNSLNLLRALIPRELEKPREAVTLLAEVLRASLAAGDRETIPLAQELETVDSYLGLERMRFGERLRVERDIRLDPAGWQIPPFLLQSLVENAVKHGITPSEEGGVVSILAEERGGMLHLCVTNPGTIGAAGRSTGMGLENARRRLAHLFGPEARLDLVQRGPGLVAAEVVIPAAKQGAGSAEPGTVR